METQQEEQINTTVIEPPPQPTGQTNPGNGTPVGLAPPIFNGDRDKSEEFLDRFLGCELINWDKKIFQVPFTKTALCLSYITGPKVDAWAKSKRIWLHDLVRTGTRKMEDNSLWDDFEADFRAAFTDTDACLTALQKFQELRMTGDDLDTYTAEFERLRETAGY
jgi:Retrotransposon gag protein